MRQFNKWVGSQLDPLGINLQNKLDVALVMFIELRDQLYCLALTFDLWRRYQVIVSFLLIKVCSYPQLPGYKIHMAWSFREIYILVSFRDEEFLGDIWSPHGMSGWTRPFRYWPPRAALASSGQFLCRLRTPPPLPTLATLRPLTVPAGGLVVRRGGHWWAHIL